MYKHIWFYKLPLCSHIFIICAVLCDLILIYPHYVISVCLLYVHVFSNILMNGVTCLHLMRKSNYQANTVLLHLLGKKIPTNNWRIMKTACFIALFKEAICNGITCSIILKNLIGIVEIGRGGCIVVSVKAINHSAECLFCWGDVRINWLLRYI